MLNNTYWKSPRSVLPASSSTRSLPCRTGGRLGGRVVADLVGDDVPGGVAAPSGPADEQRPLLSDDARRVGRVQSLRMIEQIGVDHRDQGAADDHGQPGVAIVFEVEMRPSAPITSARPGPSRAATASWPRPLRRSRSAAPSARRRCSACSRTGPRAQPPRAPRPASSARPQVRPRQAASHLPRVMRTPSLHSARYSPGGPLPARLTPRATLSSASRAVSNTALLAQLLSPKLCGTIYRGRERLGVALRQRPPDPLRGHWAVRLTRAPPGRRGDRVVRPPPGTPTTGASPTPLAPNGPSGAGTSTISVSIGGVNAAVGSA